MVLAEPGSTTVALGSTGFATVTGDDPSLTDDAMGVGEPTGTAEITAVDGAEELGAAGREAPAVAVGAGMTTGGVPIGGSTIGAGVPMTAFVVIVAEAALSLSLTWTLIVKFDWVR